MVVSVPTKVDLPLMAVGGNLIHGILVAARLFGEGLRVHKRSLRRSPRRQSPPTKRLLSWL